MFFACGIWCVVDVSSVSPSLEQTEGLWGNQCLYSVYMIIDAYRRTKVQI